MKKITFIICVFFLITSCSKTFIQVFETSTTNTQLKDRHYVYENDTIKITYAFWESKGVMSFSIYNKLEKPIFLDWKNSSFVYNGDKKNYWIDETHTDLASYYEGIFYDGPLIDPGYTVIEGIQVSSSSAVKSERITFIPPRSNFARSSFYLLPICYYESDKFISTVVPRNDNPKKQTTVLSENFSIHDSPLQFRNYLAFSLSENSQQFFYIDNEFYLSSVKEMDYRHYRKQIGKDKNNLRIYESPFKKQTSFYIIINKYYCPKGWNPSLIK